MDKIRVLHLIDSLSLGGAERMAVNLCNALVLEDCEVHLCATRKSGPLEAFIDSKVSFLVLSKARTLDLAAILRLRKYIRLHCIDIIHAHSTSFFMGSLMKWLTPVRLIWHDQYGNSENLEQRKAMVLRKLSRRFDWVFSVNKKLRNWAVQNLHVKEEAVSFLPNFSSLKLGGPLSDLNLPGNKLNRIVFIARLNKQKDHPSLVRAMCNVHRYAEDAHLLLVGEDFQDEYSDNLKRQIRLNNLSSNIHFLGGRTGVAAILQACSIGVISSESEGLPVALLEYGQAGLAVVCTDVGECSSVLGHGKYGKVVPPRDPEAMAEAVIHLLSNDADRKAYGARFKKHVENNYSGAAIAHELYGIYSGLLHE